VNRVESDEEAMGRMVATWLEGKLFPSHGGRGASAQDLQLVG